MDYAIQVQGLVNRFGSHVVHDGLDLRVRRDEIMGLVGGSGAGKSVLMRSILGLHAPQAGTIHVDGREVKPGMKNIEEVRRDVGMVFQSFNLFPHLTVVENLTIGPVRNKLVSKDEAEQRAMQYLERVHIAEQAHKYPLQLSGGQQQRVAIARSLCLEPKIMLFDEPTSALDPEMIAGVLDVMIELAEGGMTMICVTHEMGFARRVADRIVFMDFGEIVEVAEPETFFNSPQTDRARLFLSQLLGH